MERLAQHSPEDEEDQQNGVDQEPQEFSRAEPVERWVVDHEVGRRRALRVGTTEPNPQTGVTEGVRDRTGVIDICHLGLPELL